MRKVLKKSFIVFMLMALIGFVFTQTFVSVASAEDYEAKVTVKGNTTGYKTMAEAVAAVNESDGEALLEVQGNVSLTSALIFTNPNKIIITGQNKYTLTKTGFNGSMVKGNNLVLKNIILDGNSANGTTSDENGAGVQVYDGGTLELDNASIVNNKILLKGKDGGAVYAPNAKVTVKNGSLIKNNTATRSAGAVFGGEVYIEDSSIENNTAGEGNKEQNAVFGGAIYAKNLTVNTTNDENTKEEDKKYSVISANIAKGGRGGAIYMDNENGNLLIDGDTIITENTTEADASGSFTAGGAIFIKNGNATIKGNTQLIKNEAKGENGFGGAIAVGKDAKGDLNLEGKVLITENNAESKGGAIRVHEGTSKVYVKESVQITGNTAPLGKNLYIEDCKAKYERLTMSGNLAEDAIIGVRTAEDVPAEGAVFAKTDASYTGESAIVSDKDGKFSAKKDEKGNLYWHETSKKRQTNPDASTEKEAETKPAEETTEQTKESESKSTETTQPAEISAPENEVKKSSMLKSGGNSLRAPSSPANNSIIVTKETVNNEEGEFEFRVETDRFVDLSGSGLEPLSIDTIGTDLNIIGLQALGPAPNYYEVGGLVIGSDSSAGTSTGPFGGFALHLGWLGKNGSVSVPFMYNDYYAIKLVKKSGYYQLGDKPDDNWTLICPAFFPDQEVVSIKTDNRYICTIVFDDGATLMIPVPSKPGGHPAGDNGNTWTATAGIGTFEFVYDEVKEGTLSGWRFTLRNGESKELSNLPTGYTYTIKEYLTQQQKQNGWALVDVKNGNVDGGFSHRMNVEGVHTTFTNKKFPTPNALYITKEAPGNDTEEFDFSLKFTDEAYLNLLDDGMTALDYVKDPDSEWNISPHPMTKVGNRQYKVSYSSINELFVFNSPHDIAAGEMPDNTWTVTADPGFFTAGSGLAFTGDVLGTDASGLTWIMINNGEIMGIPLNNANGYIYFGYVSEWGFKLKNGETVSVENIPDDVEYIVQEKLTAQQVEDGWSLESIDGDSAKQQVREVCGAARKEHTFRNRQALPKNSITVKKEANEAGTFGFTLEVDRAIDLGNQGMTPLEVKPLSNPEVYNLGGVSASSNGYTLFYNPFTAPKIVFDKGSPFTPGDKPDNTWRISSDFWDADEVANVSCDDNYICTIMFKDGKAVKLPVAAPAGFFEALDGTWGGRAGGIEARYNGKMEVQYVSKWSFTLDAGETKRIENVPTGTNYNITENSTAGWRADAITGTAGDANFTAEVTNANGIAGTVKSAMATSGHDVTFVNKKASLEIKFDCADFIKIMRVQGRTSDETLLPSSKEIGITIDGKDATEAQIQSLIDSAEYEIYSYIAGDFVSGGEDVFELSKTVTNTGETKLKITAKKSSAVKIKFTYEGVEHTQIVCTPGDVTGDKEIANNDYLVVKRYTVDDVDDLYANTIYTHNNVAYDMFKVMADMRTQNVGVDITVTSKDAKIIKDLLNDIF